MFSGNDSFFGIILAIGILFVIFLVIREIICWYWKINEGIELLRSINDKLSTLKEIKVSESVSNSASHDEPVSKMN